MAILYIFLAAAVLFWIVLYLIYREAFHSPRKADADIFNIPTSGQYKPHREFMMDLIRDLHSRPF